MNDIDTIAFAMYQRSVNPKATEASFDQLPKDTKTHYRNCARVAFAFRRHDQLPDENTCIKCGCTESRTCAGGCGWAFLNMQQRRGLCTACLDAIRQRNGKAL